MKMNHELMKKILLVCYHTPLQEFPISNKKLEFEGFTWEEVAEHCQWLYEGKYIRSFSFVREKVPTKCWRFFTFDFYEQTGFIIGHLTLKGERVCEAFSRTKESSEKEGGY